MVTPPKAFDAEAETTSEETSTDNIAAEEAELYDDATAAPLQHQHQRLYRPQPPPTPYTSFGTEWTPTLARLAFSQGLARSADFPSKNPPSPASSPPLTSIPSQLETSGDVPSPLHHHQTHRYPPPSPPNGQSRQGNFYDEPESTGKTPRWKTTTAPSVTVLTLANDSRRSTRSSTIAKTYWG